MVSIGGGSNSPHWGKPDDESEYPKSLKRKRAKKSELINTKSVKNLKAEDSPLLAKEITTTTSRVAKKKLDNPEAMHKTAQGKKRAVTKNPVLKSESTEPAEIIEKQGSTKRARVKVQAKDAKCNPIAKKPVRESIEQIAHALKIVIQSPISPETIPQIFSLENRLRQIIASPDVPKKEAYQKLYQDQALELLQQAKDYIKQHPRHYAVQAAANKGKAALVGMQAVAATLDKGKKLKANVESNQEVILLPKHGAVLKGMDEQAKEDSYLVDSMFDLMSPQAVVGSFDMKRVDYEAKPFIPLSTFADFKEYPKALNAILEGLDYTSEFNGILTGELQLLDLHNNNLAVTCVLPEELKRFDRFRLPHSDEPLSLQEFLITYLNGDITPNTPIKFREAVIENGKTKYVTVQKTLKDLPEELQNALHAPWKLVIFDTDMSIAEDNRVQLQVLDGKKQHLIPLRNCLLETEWKNKPLSQETLELLADSQDRDQRVASWVHYDDAPIYKQLSAESKELLAALLEPRLKGYSLSYFRANPINSLGISTDATIKNLRKLFVADLCTYSEQNKILWTFLEENLQRDPKPVLTSDSPESHAKRKLIASQLFGRLTSRQQEALFDRQTKRTAYINNYQQLTASHSRGNQLLDELEAYLLLPETPLNSLEKKDYLQKLTGLRTSDENSLSAILSSLVWGAKDTRIMELKTAILLHTQPTFFSVMKAMYPLLADVYELAKAAYGEAFAGCTIGDYKYPIETIIAKVEKDYMPNTEYGQLAKKVERQVKEVQDPSFTGNLSSPKSTPKEEKSEVAAVKEAPAKRKKPKGKRL